jgi:hypothetical protein
MILLLLWCVPLNLWHGSRMRALAHSQVQKLTRACLKYIEASGTIAVGGVDGDIALPMNLSHLIEDHCISQLCSVEKGGALTHKHFQMMVKGNLSSLLLLNKKIKVCLG